MENTEKQIIEPSSPVDSLSEAELDKIAGGTSNLNLSKSNVNAVPEG